MSVPPPLHAVAHEPEERSMAALAHGSIVLNVFMPGLGIVAALAVWLTQRERSAFASKQAIQAAVYQVAWMLAPAFVFGAAIIGIVTGALIAGFSDTRVGVLAILVFVCFILLAVLVVVVGLLYALVAAYETYQGRDFRYWLIGRLVLRD